MERLAKTAIILGLGIAISIFAMALYSFIPSMINHNPWDNVELPTLSSDDAYNRLISSESYIVFYERYPNATEQYHYRDNGRHAELIVAMADFETYKSLQMDLVFDLRDDRVWSNIQCDDFSGNDRNRHHFDGPLVIQYIKQNECLD